MIWGETLADFKSSGVVEARVYEYSVGSRLEKSWVMVGDASCRWINAISFKRERFLEPSTQLDRFTTRYVSVLRATESNEWQNKDAETGFLAKREISKRHILVDELGYDHAGLLNACRCRRHL